MLDDHLRGATMYNYAIRFEQDTAPGLAVYCRDLPELNSYGDDREHAIREAVDAIETTLSIYVDQRRAIPVATAPEDGEQVIYLPAVTVAKIVLWNTMIERDMRKADLRRLLGVHQVQADRLVDFLHTSKMEQVEAALAAVGKRLAVSVEAA
jgi:antitoxin HicB